MTNFIHNRRQQFLTEDYYIGTKVELKDAIIDYLSEPNNDDNSTIEEGWEDSYFLASQSMFNLFLLEYTAGFPLDVLRNNLDDLVTIFEIYSEKLRKSFSGTKKQNILTRKKRILHKFVF